MAAAAAASAHGNGGASVAVFVLDIDRPESTNRAIASALAEGAARVLVLENGSTAANADAMAAHWAAEPRVTIYRSGVNLGFTGGHNFLLRQLGSDVPDCRRVLLLNNDADLLPGALPALAAALDALSGPGIAGPRLLHLEPEGIIASDGAATIPWLAQQRFRAAGHRVADRPPGAPRDVPFVSGACLLLDADLLRRLGGFDERYFAYFEDWDLCLRAARIGARCVHVPSAAVRHAGSATVGRNSFFYHFLMTRNRVLLARTHLPAPVFALVFLPYFLLVRVLGKGVAAFLAGDTAAPAAMVLALRWLLAAPRTRARLWPAAAAPGGTAPS